MSALRTVAKPMPSTRLDENPTTASQAKQLSGMQKKQDASLDRVKSGVDRLAEMATQMGKELDAQGQALQNAGNKAGKKRP
jgi:hypothetical protein